MIVNIQKYVKNTLRPQILENNIFANSKSPPNKG